MGYSCVACARTFVNVKTHRAHYKSDWHRYNLKRKVAGLGPMPEEMFISKRDAALRMARAQEKQDFHAKCTACSKSFSSVNAYRQHLESKKHKKLVAREAGRDRTASALSANDGTDGAGETGAEPAEAAPAEYVGSAADETKAAPSAAAAEDGASAIQGDASMAPAAPEQRVYAAPCPFCAKGYSRPETAIAHMTKEHSFFLPDPEYLTDLAGLLAYLNAKVKEGHMCLFCLRQFASGTATQKHMVDKAHCRMLYDEDKDMGEYEDFYDFRSSYPAELRKRVARSAHSAPGSGAGAAAATGAGAGAGAADGVDGGSSDEDEDLTLSDLRRGVRVLPTGELRMRDGRVVGHRMYKRYYRQNTGGTESEAVTAQRAAIMDGSAGGTVVAGRARGSSTALAVQRGGGVYSAPLSRDQAARGRRHHEDRRKKREMQVGVRANKVGQTYFRAQVMF